MPRTLTEKAVEESTFGIVITFGETVDGVFTPVTPDTMTWTLTDGQGNVINNRLNVAISPLDDTVTVVLSGDDLVIETYGLQRVVTFRGTYDSSLGTNKPFVDWVKFEMNDAVAVT